MLLYESLSGRYINYAYIGILYLPKGSEHLIACVEIECSEKVSEKLVAIMHSPLIILFWNGIKYFSEDQNNPPVLYKYYEFESNHSLHIISIIGIIL
jgi:hypothetical protein